MNQQNRLAFGLTGLTTFILGAGSYWLAFDRPSEASPASPTTAATTRRDREPEKLPPKARKTRLKKKEQDGEGLSRRKHTKPSRKPKVRRNRKTGHRPRTTSSKKVQPPAG